jgi:hypothetical protein
MIGNFKMEIGKADFLRILNVGIKWVASTSITDLIQSGDKVVDVQYSRSTKQYTLVFESGHKVRVSKAQQERQKAQAATPQ